MDAEVQRQIDRLNLQIEALRRLNGPGGGSNQSGTPLHSQPQQQQQQQQQVDPKVAEFLRSVRGEPTLGERGLVKGQQFQAVDPQDVGQVSQQATRPQTQPQAGGPQVNRAATETPDLWATFQNLQAQKAELEKVVGPIRQRRDEVVGQMAPFEAEARRLADELKKYMPQMGAIDRQLGLISRMMPGNRSVGQAGPAGPEHQR